MTTVKEKEEKTVLERVADYLIEAQRELDELAVQLALGKAEAKLKFEEVKAEFKSKLADFRKLLDEAPDSIPAKVKQGLEKLELQLALGKAETRDAFEEQKDKLLAGVAHIEKEIKDWLDEFGSTSAIGHEIEKFKLKLEILRLKFNLKKFEISDDFHESMSNARRAIQKIGTAADAKLERGRRNMYDFGEEMAEAYQHLRKAVKNLGR
ncbi:MAG: hypothetical protein AB7K37_09440 [Cyclobacteriaceae bacterium]